MPTSIVWFYLPDREPLGGIDAEALDPDRDAGLMTTGLYAWILQTFLRLRAADLPVRLVQSPPGTGTVVVHVEHVERLLADAPAPDDLFVVTPRMDRRPQVLADLEVVQNITSIGPYQAFVPFWLQPGLIPRNEARGERLETATFMGFRESLADELATSCWADALSAAGFTWDLRVLTFGRNEDLLRNPWSDYSAVDAVVALRPRSAWPAAEKPASKLVNAWAAGVPAVLGPEVAYRELRRTPLDYIEVESPTEALAALVKLRDDSDLYSAMVANGRVRAREFGHERVAARWADLLWRDVPARSRTYRHRVSVKRRRERAVVRRLRHRIAARRPVL